MKRPPFKGGSIKGACPLHITCGRWVDESKVNFLYNVSFWRLSKVNLLSVFKES